MEIDLSTQIAPDGNRYPIGAIPAGLSSADIFPPWVRPTNEPQQNYVPKFINGETVWAPDAEGTGGVATLALSELTDVDLSTLQVGDHLQWTGTTWVPADAPADGEDGADGVDGIGVTGTTIDENGHLIVTLSDSTTIDAGLVRGTDGVDGEDGEAGPAGTVTIITSETAPTNPAENVGTVVWIDLTGEA